MPKIELKKYLLYASLALPLSLLGLPLYVYLPTFYAQDVGLGVFQVGFVLLFARLFDMILDPFIGYCSDRFAMRKPFIFVGMLTLLGGFYFLTHPSSDAGYLWLFSFSMMSYFGWSLMSVAYYALGSDLGENYASNTKYASFRELFNILGVLLALILPYAYSVSDNPREALRLLFIAIFILLPALTLLFFVRLKSPVLVRSMLTVRNAFAHFLTQVTSSRKLFAAFFLNSLAAALPATLFLLYTELVIGAKEFTGALLLVYFFCGVFALPAWNYLSSKTSKKFAWICSMASASFFFSFVPFLSFGDLNYFFIVTVFTGLSLGADMALPASMQADIAQSSSQNSREFGATLFGFFAMITKLSLAFGVGVSFAVLGLFDFTPINPNETSLFVLSLLYGAFPVTLKLCAIAILSGYKEKSTDL